MLPQEKGVSMGFLQISGHWKQQGLSARAANCLARMNCLTVDDVASISEDNFRLEPNLGLKTRDEILAFVKRS
ncbi:DNA-directed RNA polymerase subunit alpha C-terminal domain-containing protein [Croceicoccus sp. Ery15]|uniref:DNA-directed RNA polymerase subunit alpha C-terminal domain-containing protein n=1 Tax=Croceicoccus sp. Ery15 TaxID=1703338 RepID=UPI001E3E021A|nr:DNA-directed RNA polymerase subunit alpha C-terminal domain-containing protein [Croceicoccus sp. Ery15]